MFIQIARHTVMVVLKAVQKIVTFSMKPL